MFLNYSFTFCKTNNKLYFSKNCLRTENGTFIIEVVKEANDIYKWDDFEIISIDKRQQGLKQTHTHKVINEMVITRIKKSIIDKDFIEKKNYTTFYFYIRGHIRNSFENDKLKIFINLLKNKYPNIIFILQPWKQKECKPENTYKNIKKTNNIITYNTIARYFEDNEIIKNCTIIDESTIKLHGSTDRFVGGAPKKGWKNMWCGIFYGLHNLKLSDNKIVVFRFDNFTLPTILSVKNNIRIIRFIDYNLDADDKIKFIYQDDKLGVDNLFIGSVTKVMSLIKLFHFKLDDILKHECISKTLHKDGRFVGKIKNQELIVPCIANII